MSEWKANNPDKRINGLENREEDFDRSKLGFEATTNNEGLSLMNNFANQGIQNSKQMLVNFSNSSGFQSHVRSPKVVQVDSHDDFDLDYFLSFFGVGAMILDEEGKVEQTTTYCNELLAKYFPRVGIRNNPLPRKLQNWIDTCPFDAPDKRDLSNSTQLLIQNADDLLRIRLTVLKKKKRTLLFEERKGQCSSDLIPLGLTRREAEVLLLISKGKTSPEIGVLLNIRPKTVENHTAKIFEKLGVETRTAAMLRVQSMNW